MTIVIPTLNDKHLADNMHVHPTNSHEITKEAVSEALTTWVANGAYGNEDNFVLISFARKDGDNYIRGTAIMPFESLQDGRKIILGKSGITFTTARESDELMQERSQLFYATNHNR